MIRKKTWPENLITGMQWYDDVIYNPERDRLFMQYGFSSSRAVSSNAFEIWAAMLLKLQKAGPSGEDLPGWEIKSARGGQSKDSKGRAHNRGTRFTYEYYPHSGLNKLKNECTLQHMYIVYTESYASVDMWVIPGRVLTPIFDVWKTDITEYLRLGRRGRRDVKKTLPYGFVKTYARQAMQIRKGKLTFCDKMFGAALGVRS